MFRRAFLLLALPIAGIVAQSTPVLVTIRSSSDANYRIIRSPNDAAQGTVVVGGVSSKLSVPVGVAETISLVSDDSTSRFHVEATDGSRVIASVDGAFVVVRRDSGFVSVEGRNRSPFALPPTGTRKLDAGGFAIPHKPD